MGAFSLSHILVIAIVAVLLFGRGKVSELMGDLGKGIRSFKKSMAEDAAAPAAATPAPAQLANRAAPTAQPAAAAPAREA